jgi:hypothetical protein
LEPQVTVKYVDKYIEIPEELTKKVVPVFKENPVWFMEHTWLDLHDEHNKNLESCNYQLYLIQTLPLPTSPNK